MECTIRWQNKQQDATQSGKFAPQFAALNDDVSFGEVWAKENELSAHDRSMITIACLMTSGDFPQLKAHLQLGKEHGLYQRRSRC